MSEATEESHSAGPSDTGSLTAKAVSGAAWSTSGRVAVQVISFVGTIVLARLLSPKAYGVVGIARVVTGFVDIFRDLGTTSAVIQRRETTQELLSSLFWANLVLGLITTIIIILIAPETALFFKEPLVRPIIQFLAVGFLVTSIGSIHAALLARQMLFRQIAIIETIAAVSTTAVSVLLAWNGAGVWSLVSASIMSNVASTFLFWLSSAWRPSFIMSWSQIKSVTSYSLNLSGYSAINYLSRNADNAIVGRFLGAFQLGFYQIAYNVMLYAVQNVSFVLGRVLFPAFVKVRDDNERFRKAYIKGCSMIAVFTFPAMLGLLVVSRPFVLVVLGSKWLPVASLIAILAPVGLIQSLMSTTGNIYSAKGRTDMLFKWGLFAGTVYIISFCAGIPWGIVGVAKAYLIANVCLFYPVFAIPFRLIELTMMEFMKPIWAILLSSGLMAVSVKTLQLATSNWMPVKQLCLLSFAGVAVYVSLLLVIRPAAFLNLVAVLQPFFKRRHSNHSKLGKELTSEHM